MGDIIKDPDLAERLPEEGELYRGIVFSDFDAVMAPQGCEDISAETIEAVNGFRELGYRFAIASGKPLGYILGCCSRSDVIPDFVVAENGGIVYMDGEINREPTGDLLRLKGMMVLDDGRIRGGPDVRIFKTEEKDVIYTPYVEGGMEGAVVMKDYFDRIIEREGLNLDVYAHPDGGVDVVPGGMSKVTGIARIREKYGEGHTIAIGDGNNDREMLSDVDFPATVGNAQPAVVELVTSRGGYIAENTNGKGLREIYQFIRDQGSGLMVPAGAEAVGNYK